MMMKNDIFHGGRGIIHELYRLGLSVSEFSRFSGLCFNTIKRIHDGLPVSQATIGRVELALDKARAQVKQGFDRSVRWKELRKEKAS
jgi:hypothetical protein